MLVFGGFGVIFLGGSAAVFYEAVVGPLYWPGLVGGTLLFIAALLNIGACIGLVSEHRAES